MSENEKMYRFVSNGNKTIGLIPSGKKTITDASGAVLGTKVIPPITAVFDNGYFETTNATIAKLLQENEAHWGIDVFWHPTCVPHDPDGKENKEALVASKAIAEKARKRVKVRHRQAEAAKEGNIPVE